jgi:hypothetical protein
MLAATALMFGLAFEQYLFVETASESVRPWRKNGRRAGRPIRLTIDEFKAIVLPSPRSGG